MPNGNVRILFIDDDKFILELVGWILTSLGYHGVPAQNGEEALRILADSDDFQLILTDIDMPEMDGFELVWRIKQINPEIPIVALTGKDPDRYLFVYINAFRRTGCSGLLYTVFFTGGIIVDKGFFHLVIKIESLRADLHTAFAANAFILIDSNMYSHLISPFFDFGGRR